MIRLDRGLDRVRPSLLHEAERIERLAADLRRMAEGAGPSPDDLAAAAVLDDWLWTERLVPCLVGTGFGHPRLPNGPVMTTGVWVADVSHGWARTLGRYYVLGDPAEPPPAMGAGRSGEGG